MGSEAMKLATKVKKEHLDEALHRPDSFEIYLHDMTNVSQKSEFDAHLLIINSQAPGLDVASVNGQGGISDIKSFEDWITDINAAKQREVSIQPSHVPVPQPIYQQSAPLYIAQPAPPPQPQYIVPPTIPPVQTSSVKFCTNCGQPTTPQNKFCKNCGVALNAQQPTCPKCGNPLNPGQKFCNMCGTPHT